VRILYKGLVDIDQLLEDVTQPEGSLHDRLEHAALLPGRLIDHPLVRKTAESLEATWTYRWGRAFEATDPIHAIHYFSKALAYRSDFTKARIHRGKVYLEHEKSELAEKDFRFVVDNDPNAPEGPFEMGMLAFQQGRTTDAIQWLRQSLIRDKEFEIGLNNLAWILAAGPAATERNPVEALALANEAVRLSQRSVAEYLDTLATVLLANGQQQEAVSTLEEALALARLTGEEATRRSIEATLQQLTTNASTRLPER
jgi:tetratricopeptide (TPR) repeat protein